MTKDAQKTRTGEVRVPEHAARPQVFLFLQGPPNGFWPRLADGLEAAGHRTVRVNLCSADWLFWRRKGAINYRGSLRDWPDWLERLMSDEGITDLIYYADQLPYHLAARRVGEARGARPWAIEFGYLRPDWITMEPGGMGSASSWPRDAASIRQLAHGTPEPDMQPRYTHSFAEEATGEVLFNLAAVFGWPFFPRYISDKPQHPVIDYLCWLPELIREPFQKRRAAQIEAACRDRDWPYHLVALQLQTDYQIRASTKFEHLEEMLEELVASFSQHAASGHRLVVKVHPLDNGTQNWPKRLARIASGHGVADRIHLVKGGDLGAMISNADGVIVANSTVGLHALQAEVPVLAMGDAVYDVPGLTHQDGLAAFWQNPAPVDTHLMAELVRALAGHIQIKGSFYNREGQKVAIEQIIPRLTCPAPICLSAQKT